VNVIEYLMHTRYHYLTPKGEVTVKDCVDMTDTLGEQYRTLLNQTLDEVSSVFTKMTRNVLDIHMFDYIEEFAKATVGAEEVSEFLYSITTHCH